MEGYFVFSVKNSNFDKVLLFRGEDIGFIRQVYSQESKSNKIEALLNYNNVVIEIDHFSFSKEIEGALSQFLELKKALDDKQGKKGS